MLDKYQLRPKSNLDCSRLRKVDWTGPLELYPDELCWFYKRPPVTGSDKTQQEEGYKESWRVPEKKVEKDKDIERLREWESEHTPQSKNNILTETLTPPSGSFEGWIMTGAMANSLSHTVPSVSQKCQTGQMYNCRKSIRHTHAVHDLYWSDSNVEMTLSDARFNRRDCNWNIFINNQCNH